MFRIALADTSCHIREPRGAVSESLNVLVGFDSVIRVEQHLENRGCCIRLMCTARKKDLRIITMRVWREIRTSFEAAEMKTQCSIVAACTTWIRRLQSVSIVRPVDAGNPWTWKGRTMSNSVLVRFHVAEEVNDAGFDVRGQDVHLNSQSHVCHEDLGELLPASVSLDHRTEVVLETTVDDARRVRQIPDVNHISQR